MLDRRSFFRNCSAFAAFAAVGELALAAEFTVSSTARRWLALHGELARGLRSGALEQGQWHAGVNSLARDLDLEHLASELRRARVKDAGPPFGHDPQKRFVTVLNDEGRPQKLGYGLALFDFRPGSVITPHAHQHMVSAHLVIEGRVRVRTFDRIRDESDALLIQPALDLVAEPGYSAAMTSAKDNVHWFAPRTRRAMTLDVIIDGLDAGQAAYLIQPVDPLGGVRLHDGSIRAPLVSFERSMALYSTAR